jgi:hypothetical protein
VPLSASKIAKNIDVRSHNSYTLLPPSRTAAGPKSADGEYTWIERGKPAFRQDALIEKCKAGHREKHPDADTWIIPADLPENVAEAIKWIQTKAEPAILHQGGRCLRLCHGRHDEKLWPVRREGHGSHVGALGEAGTDAMEPRRKI